MTKSDPIIAVKNVNISAEWYQTVFGCKRSHGGNDFAVLKDINEEILFCLHKWGEHEHPTLMNPDIIAGNGLILLQNGRFRDNPPEHRANEPSP